MSDEILDRWESYLGRSRGWHRTRLLLKMWTWNAVVGSSRLLKRLFDLLVGGSMLVLSSPLWAALLLAIRLDSPGPVFFKQTRVGRRGRLFLLYKFRTMYVDAERRKAELSARNETGGVIFKMKDDPRITPVATLDAPLLQVRTVRPGESIGYGATFTVEKPTRIGIIALGYADGVLRSASGSGYGWLSGRRCDLVGRISMDLIAINVSDVEDAAPGQRVELFGVNLPLDLAAAQAGTIAYELLSRVSPRVQRRYQGRT